MITTKQCPICGATFETKWTHKKYCSAECYDKADRRKQTEYRKKQKKQPTAPRILKCAWCGADFTPTGTKQRFCSVKCCNNGNNAIKRQRNAERRARAAEREFAAAQAQMEEETRETQIHVGTPSLTKPGYDVARDGKTLVRVMRSKWETRRTEIRT